MSEFKFAIGLSLDEISDNRVNKELKNYLYLHTILIGLDVKY